MRISANWWKSVRKRNTQERYFDFLEVGYAYITRLCPDCFEVIFIICFSSPAHPPDLHENDLNLFDISRFLTKFHLFQDGSAILKVTSLQVPCFIHHWKFEGILTFCKIHPLTFPLYFLRFVISEIKFCSIYWAFVSPILIFSDELARVCIFILSVSDSLI